MLFPPVNPYLQLLALWYLVSSHLFYRQLGLKYSVLCPPEVNVLPIQGNFSVWVRKHKRHSSIPKTLLGSSFFSGVLSPTSLISSSLPFTDMSSSCSLLKVRERPSLFPLYLSLSLLLPRKHLKKIWSTVFDLSYGLPKQPKSLLKG